MRSVRRSAAKPAKKDPSPRRASRDERFVARIPSDEKALLQRAAERRGQSLSAYVIEKAKVAAVTELEEAGELVLTRRDQRMFASLLLDPPRATDRLRAAIASAETLARRR
jgi:uncharacterized protein (DUF1778 family)